MNLKSILLGLINLHPSISGYELKTIINKSTGYFFTASLSMIYPALKELTQEGLITYDVEPLVGKQDRKVYTITAGGLERLKDWLREPLQLDPSLNAFEDFLLKLTFIGIMDDACVLDYLKAAQKHFQDEKKRFSENMLKNEKEYIRMGPPMDARYLSLWVYENEYILDDLARKVEWIENLIEQVKSGSLQPGA